LLNISICDDENEIVGQLKRLIYETFPESQSAIEVTGFASGPELCAALDAGKYFDLIFMDIEMGCLLLRRRKAATVSGLKAYMRPWRGTTD
jgi:CheY-like chemotaxis protein